MDDTTTRSQADATEPGLTAAEIEASTATPTSPTMRPPAPTSTPG
jgi:hypothetical protein